MRIVMYRVGIHRTAYHVRGDCPALTGMRDTCNTWAAVPEEEALDEPLKLAPCTKCAD